MKKLLFIFILLAIASSTQAVLTVTSSVIDEWAAVAEGATDESTVINIASNYATYIHIQAFTDMNDAHEGTEFRVQVSGNSSGDEDWTDFHVFTALVGDGEAEPLDADPAAGAVLTVSDTLGAYETATTTGRWLAIEDGTLANSELVWQVAFVADTSITVQDTVTNAHAISTLIWDVAMSQTIMVPMGCGSRARVICNNGYDLDGTASSLNWKVGKTVTTGL